jgi:hypothetical protein
LGPEGRSSGVPFKVGAGTFTGSGAKSSAAFTLKAELHHKRQALATDKTIKLRMFFNNMFLFRLLSLFGKPLVFIITNVFQAEIIQSG